MSSGTSGNAPPRATGLVDLDCRRCRLHTHRTQVVPAEGPRGARLFLLGEGPGPDEDAQGRPFIGRAGVILRRCLARAGVPEDEVWISNTVKCFPQDRVDGKAKIRRPKPDEADACRPWLAAELDAVRPAVVLAVGASAATHATGDRALRVKDARGRLLRARAELGGVPLMVTYHPSGLRYGHATEADLAEDLRAAYAHAVGRAAQA